MKEVYPRSAPHGYGRINIHLHIRLALDDTCLLVNTLDVVVLKPCIINTLGALRSCPLLLA